MCSTSRDDKITQWVPNNNWKLTTCSALPSWQNLKTHFCIDWIDIHELQKRSHGSHWWFVIEKTKEIPIRLKKIRKSKVVYIYVASKIRTHDILIFVADTYLISLQSLCTITICKRGIKIKSYSLLKEFSFLKRFIYINSLLVVRYKTQKLRQRGRMLNNDDHELPA